MKQLLTSYFLLLTSYFLLSQNIPDLIDQNVHLFLRADGDPVEIADTRFGEVTDEYASFLKLQI